MDSDDDICTPPDILELATKVTHNKDCQAKVPEKSRKLYEKEYNNFLAWQIEKKTTSFSEKYILAYLKDLSDKFKPSSLWAKYSMLKSTLSINNNIDITKYSKVIAFLKRSLEGHNKKKSLTFTSGQIKMFLEDSPDTLYLFEKVALIFGIMGACRRQELYNMQFDKVSNIDDSTIMVKLMRTKTQIDRSFVVTGNCYAVCKKYMELRPTPCRNPAFFLSYKSGKCFDQRTGINTFGALGKNIARFLNLPNPALYTGHCFRRTSASLLIDSGGDLTALKRHGGWKSSSVVKSYMCDESLMNKIQGSNTILNSIENKKNEAEYAGPDKIYTQEKTLDLLLTLDEDPEESEEESHSQGSQEQEPPNVFALKSTGLTPMTPMTPMTRNRKRKLLTHTYSPIKESQEKTLDEDPEESEEESHSQGSQEQKPPIVIEFKSTGLTPMTPMTRKRKQPTHTYSPETVREPNDHVNLIEPIENEFDLFCKSLAIQLKKMPLDRALICQEKLQSVMTQERLAQVEHAAPLIKLENQYDSDSSS